MDAERRSVISADDSLNRPPQSFFSFNGILPIKLFFPSMQCADRGAGPLKAIITGAPRHVNNIFSRGTARGVLRRGLRVTQLFQEHPAVAVKAFHYRHQLVFKDVGEADDIINFKYVDDFIQEVIYHGIFIFH